MSQAAARYPNCAIGTHLKIPSLSDSRARSTRERSRTRNVVNPQAAIRNQLVDLVHAYLCGIIGRQRAPGDEAAIVHGEDDRVEERGVSLVERAVDEDVGVVRHRSRYAGRRNRGAVSGEALQGDARFLTFLTARATSLRETVPSCAEARIVRRVFFTGARSGCCLRF